MDEAYSYRTSAPKGAELLDQVMPGWVEKIDLDALDLGSPYTCVLAQLAETDLAETDDDYGPRSDYGVGRSQVFALAGITPDDDAGEDGYYWLAVEYGFDYSFSQRINAPVSLLQDEWQMLINERAKP